MRHQRLLHARGGELNCISNKAFHTNVLAKLINMSHGPFRGRGALNCAIETPIATPMPECLRLSRH